MDRLLGVQIVRIPRHIHVFLGELKTGDVQGYIDKYPGSVEPGFITGKSAFPGALFCRFWKEGRIGVVLRTLANSELCDVDRLVFYKSTSDEMIRRALIEIGYGEHIDMLFEFD